MFSLIKFLCFFILFDFGANFKRSLPYEVKFTKFTIWFNPDKSGFYSAIRHCGRRVFISKSCWAFIQEKVPFSSCFFCTEFYPESSFIIGKTFEENKLFYCYNKSSREFLLLLFDDNNKCSGELLLLLEKAQEKVRREPCWCWIRRWGDPCEVGSHKCWVYSDVTWECDIRVPHYECGSIFPKNAFIPFRFMYNNQKVVLQDSNK